MIKQTSYRFFQVGAIFVGTFSMILIYVVSERPPEDLPLLAAYCPDLSLSPARGWMDIIYLQCVITLLPALDHRTYDGRATPAYETHEGEVVLEEYVKWGTWLATNYTFTGPNGSMDWETEIFSVQYTLLSQ